MITKPATPGEHPMPGEQIGDAIVIASVISRVDPDGWTLLMLNPSSPYYMVGTGEWVDEIFVWDETHNHMNIVPAVNGDAHPNPDPNHPGRRVGPRADGYVDMGGDY